MEPCQGPVALPCRGSRNEGGSLTYATVQGREDRPLEGEWDGWVTVKGRAGRVRRTVG